MRDFLVEYGSLRFALDRQDYRRRGKHGFIASALLLGWYLLVMMILLPIAAVQLVVEAGEELREAKRDPAHRGRIVSGRRRQPDE